MTEASITALGNLRTLTTFEWYLVPFLALVIYAYSLEVRSGNWDRVITGIGFFGGELIWEMFNALVLHFTQYAALWTVSGKSVFLIFVGLNVEIALMFALAPLALFNILPADRGRNIVGMPNRIVIPVCFGLFCVMVESLLNRWGALAWAYRWWSWPNVWLIIIAYSGPFTFIAWFNDRVSLKNKVIAAAACWALAGIGFVVFAVFLRWI
ncbi:MAG TPA: hypothetical protein PLG31_03590 [Spirochaetota bacterium]|nr:hypothetical protein [Spirochaetota bacterium]